MKMCSWVSFGIYSTWHRPPVAENWLGQHCKAKLLPSQQQVAAWHELLCADLNPNLLRTAVLCWEILLLFGCCQGFILTHASCCKPQFKYQKTLYHPRSAGSPAAPSQELPSVPLSLDAAVSSSLSCISPHFGSIISSGSGGSPALGNSWAEQKAWVNLSPPWDKVLEVATLF